MDNIVDLNERQKSIEVLKKIKKVFLATNKVIRKDDISNYSYLIKNYENQSKKLKSGYLSDNEILIFYKKLTNAMSKQNDRGNKLYVMLLFYNIFKNYDVRILELDDNDISLCIDTLLSFVDEEHISKIEKSLDFVFNKKIFKELKSLSNDEKHLFYNMVDIVDMYSESPNFSSSYHALYIIEDIKETKVNDIYVVNVQNVSKKVMENAYVLAALINETNELKAEHLISAANMLEFKLNNLNDDEKDECCYYIEDLFNQNIPLETKLNMIYDKVEELYNNKKKK